MLVLVSMNCYFLVVVFLICGMACVTNSGRLSRSTEQGYADVTTTSAFTTGTRCEREPDPEHMFRRKLAQGEATWFSIEVCDT